MASPKKSASTPPPRVGKALQRLRLERSMTLEDLSRASGVSRSMLSEIERDKANPTIAVAWRLANALGLSLDQLFAPGRSDTAAIRVVGLHETPSFAGIDKKYLLRILGPMDLAGRFEWYELSLAPEGALVSEAHDPGTRENLTMLGGTVEVSVANASMKIKAGETARYPADKPHAIRNIGKTSAHALLVVIHG